jgi:signal transduction histidine kinase
VNNFASLSSQLVQELSEELASERSRMEEETLENVDELLGLLRQNIEKIESHGKRANRIITGMLQHSRDRVGERGPTDIGAVVVESVTLAIQGRKSREPDLGVEVVTSYDHDIGTIDGVAVDLGRVFVNLIDNACFAVAQKKKSLGSSYRPEIRITTKGEASQVEIRVRDNGTGIRPDAVDKIFMPFFTTKPPGEGTGLGLSMTHDIIVEAHRGSITVDTRPGEFTEFIVRLPRRLAVKE